MKAYKSILAIFFIFLMVLLPSISALDFDNCKEYNADTKVVKIKNMCPLGIDWFAEEMANIQLTTPLNVLVASGDDILVAETKVCGKAEFKDMMKGFETYDVKNNMAKKEKVITMREKIVSFEEVPTYSDVCESVQDLIQNSTNGTTYHQECVKTQTGTENKEVVSWKTISQKDIKEGCYDVGLFTNVQAGDYIEWIPNYFGVRIEEWASFQQSTAVGLVSYYRLDETSGTTVMDDMIRNHGVNSGATANVNGILNKAYNFTTATGQINISDSTNFKPTTGMTISSWVYRYGTTDDGIFSKLNTATENNKNYVIYIETNKVKFLIGDGSAWKTAYGSTTLSANQWYHVVGRWNGTHLNIYVNGILEGGTAEAISTPSYGVTKVMLGMTFENGAYAPMNGLIDEVGFWNRSLTASEITELYNSGTGLNNPRTSYAWNDYNLSTGAVSYYKLDETSGTNAVDTLNRYNGTTTGATVNQVGKLNKAYSFDGGDSINTAIDTEVNTDPFSISFWINSTSTGSQKIILQKNNGFTIYKQADNTITLTKNGITDESTTATANQNEWTNFVYMIGTDNKQRLYKNGILVYTGSNTANIASSTGNNLVLGNTIIGLLDEIGIWNTSLSATQIQALYNYSSALIYASSPIPPFVTTSVSPAHGYSTNIASVVHTCNATTTATLTNISLVVDGTIVATNTSVSGNSSQVTFNYTYADGSYDWNCIAFDNTSANASSTTRAITIETTEPVITANLSNSTLYVLGGNLTLNYNITHLPDIGGVTAWYSYNGTNRSLDTSQNSINFTTATGQYDLVLYANDTFGNDAIPVVLTYTLDTTKPQFVLVSLPNVTTTTMPVNATMNVTSSDVNLNTCKYYTSDNATNITYTCNTAQNVLFATGGTKTIYVWANDSVGNENQTSYSVNVYDFTYQQSGSASVGVGEQVTFTFNISSNSFAIGDADAELWYNNVNYGTGTKTIVNSTLIRFTTTITIANGTGNSTGYPRNWLWNYETTQLSNRNSTTQTTNVYSVEIAECGSGYPILILSLKDEELNSLVNVTAPNEANIELDLTISSQHDNTIYFTFSKKWTNNNSVSVCVPTGLVNVSTYNIDFIIGYDSTDHVRKFYYLEDGVLDTTGYFNSYTDNTIDLMDLLTADSTTFLFAYTDASNQEVADIIVHTYRKYIGEGLFREVERSKQDNNGQTHVHLVEEDVIYYFMISQYGDILFTSDTYNAKCLSTPCSIELSASQTNFNWSIIDNEGGKYTTTTSKSTRITTTNFDLDSISNVSVSLYQLQGGNTTLINTSSLTASGGSIDLNVPVVYGNQTFFVAIEKDGVFVKSAWVDLTPTGRDYFGTTGALLGGLIVLALLLMAISEGVGAIVFTCLALFVVGIMKLVDLNAMALISIICAGGVIVWKLVNRQGRQN